MVTDNYIQNNKTETLKKGDEVVMHTCYEASIEEYKNKVWVCLTNSFLSQNHDEVIFLEGFSGYFFVKFLKKRKKSAYQIWKESKDKNRTTEEFREDLKTEGIIVKKSTL